MMRHINQDLIINDGRISFSVFGTQGTIFQCNFAQNIYNEIMFVFIYIYVCIYILYTVTILLVFYTVYIYIIYIEYIYIYVYCLYCLFNM